MDTNEPIAGNLVSWDQRAIPLTAAEITANTADPLFTDGCVAAARYDLPDLSTPYLPAIVTPNPATQAPELSDSIASRTVGGEFFNLASLGAAGIAASATFGALTRSNVSNGFTAGWGYFTAPRLDSNSQEAGVPELHLPLTSLRARRPAATGRRRRKGPGPRGGRGPPSRRP